MADVDKLKKLRFKCKDCQHAQNCCRGNFLCKARNYEWRHFNCNACSKFKPKTITTNTQ